MPLKTDGTEIRRRRDSRALTQAEFADLVGVRPNTVSRVELGDINGGPRFIRAAAEVLGCRIEDITDGRIEDRRSRRPKAEVG